MSTKLNKNGQTVGYAGRTPEGWKNTEAHKWPKGTTGNPNGRPKNRVKEIMEGCLTKKQIQENTNLDEKDINAIEQIILSLDTKALQAIAKSDSAPTYMRSLAMAAVWDMKNGKTQTMNLLRDRQFGSVKKQVDVTTSGQSLNDRELSDKEARDLIIRLEKEF